MSRLVAAVVGRLRGILPGLPAVPEIPVTSTRFGSAYGGWDVIPALLGRDAVVYSFGVGEDASFDLALIEQFGITVHAFDPTPKAIAWVGRQHFNDRFRFFPVGIADEDGEVLAYAPEDPAHASYSVISGLPGRAVAIPIAVKRLATIMQELGHDHVDLLKMDIEGAEYRVIDDLCRSGIRPKQILLEFHHFLPGMDARTTRTSLRALRKCGYRIFSVTPSGHEYGLVHC